MASYIKLTDFSTKDALPSGDPAKVVRGTEINDEFDAIQTAILTKADVVGGELENIVVNGGTF